MPAPSIVFKRRLRWADADAAGRLHFKVGKLGRTSIRYDYQVFDESEVLAIEGTMTVVVLRDGRPTEIPLDLRAALGGETAELG